jgi:uncharacterized NAD-dependent epimerase/dehydratase family protein
MPVISPGTSTRALPGAGRLTSLKARFVGVSLNTSRLGEADARVIMNNTAPSLDLPCVDPIRSDVEFRKAFHVETLNEIVPPGSR